ncbi:MAG: tetratricopeptide repeat protein [Chloroflexi bacterium]|nr:tetratricopeptide repeat protein [Chloroflexota bacterium]
MAQQVYGMIENIYDRTVRKFYQGKLDRATAISVILRQLSVARHVDQRLVGKGYNILALLSFEVGNYTEALDYFQKAQIAFNDVDHMEGVASTLTHIGEVFRELGNYDEAIYHYQQARLIAEAHDEEYQVVFALSNEGGANLERGDIDTAILLMELAMMRLQGMHKWHPDIQHRLIPEVLGNLGHAYAQQRDFDQAWAYVERALLAAEQNGDLHSMGKVHQSMMKISLLDERPTDEVFDHFQKAAYYMYQINAVAELGHLFNAAAQLWEREGDMDNALSAYEEAARYFTDAELNHAAREIREKLVLYQS